MESLSQIFEFARQQQRGWLLPLYLLLAVRGLLGTSTATRSALVPTNYTQF
jgi:hypothetical protein